MISKILQRWLAWAKKEYESFLITLIAQSWLTRSIKGCKAALLDMYSTRQEFRHTF